LDHAEADFDIDDDGLPQEKADLPEKAGQKRRSRR